MDGHRATSKIKYTRSCRDFRPFRQQERRQFPDQREEDITEDPPNRKVLLINQSIATVVRPLDGAEGYLRWKESVLLRLRTVRVAYVLFEDPPAGDEGAPAAKKRAHDDALCRGHILDTLSDRLFPDYVRHTTAREAWDAVARTYDVDTSEVAQRRFNDFVFDEGAPLLEQIAHAEALAAAADPPYKDSFVARSLAQTVPEDLAIPLIACPGALSMSVVWRAARIAEARRLRREDERQAKVGMAVESRRQCWTCGKNGHIARNCTA